MLPSYFPVCELNLIIPVAPVGLCAVLPTGNLKASVEPDMSKSYAGELVLIPTWSSDPSTNIACVSPFDSTLKSTLAELSLIVTLPPSNSTAPDAVKVVTVAAAAVLDPNIPSKSVATTFFALMSA